MQTNIFITWYCGYYASICGEALRLLNGQIIFYSEDAHIVVCKLTDSVMFNMSVKCAFNHRRKVNFKRNEVFVVPMGNQEHQLYIPMKAVNFRHDASVDKEINDGLITLTRKYYSFNGDCLCFWNKKCDEGIFKAVQARENRISFYIAADYRYTEKYHTIAQLKEQIQAECGVDITSYDLNKILDKFNITPL